MSNLFKVCLLIFLVGYCKHLSGQIPVDFQRFDGEFIGGYMYGNHQNKPKFKKKFVGGIMVYTATELISHLRKARPGDKFFLVPTGNFDFSGFENIIIPQGVTIYSDRGINLSSGALIYSDNLKTNPLFRIVGDDVTVFGIRFRGPDGHSINKPELEKSRNQLKRKNPKLDTNTSKFLVYGIPNSSCFHVYSKGVLIQNCEISHWSHAGIFLRKGGVMSVLHNHIHHNQRTGLGYGITSDGGHSYIGGNLFDYNRHAIAGTGVPGTSYIAEGNVSLENHSSHIFDMHGGQSRKDGTNIAGEFIEVRNNLFYTKGHLAFFLRGTTEGDFIAEDNVIIYFGKEQKIKELGGNYFFRKLGDRSKFSLKGNVVKYK